jgi:hypothetical protein
LTFKQLSTNFFISIEAFFDYFKMPIFAHPNQ